MILSAALLGSGSAHAQIDALEQLTLDLQKLKELKGILSDMYTYYSIIQQDYEEVKGIAKGNFTLHQTFLDALLTVGASIAGDPAIAIIANDQMALAQIVQAAIKRANSDPYLTPVEVVTLTAKYASLLEAAADDLQELTMVLTSGTLRMSDDERLSAINRVHLRLQQKLRQIRTYQQTITEIDIARANGSTATLKNLYGL